MISKISHDAKFTIVVDESSPTAYLNSGSKVVSIWEIAYTVYIDCLCAPNITIENKLKCKVKTPKNEIEFTVNGDFSITETLASICEIIKI